ncbi:MAG: hypothetical protein ABIR94_10765 [Rubrivivax sp.]
MRRWLAAALCISAAAAHGAAEDCGRSLGSTATRLSEGGVVLIFNPSIRPIAAGQHFSVDFVLCAAGPAADEVRVDAQTPEHRHGMNYRASVRPLGNGSYRAEGLLFHMPGRWNLIFDVRRGNTVLRLSQALQVE